jgi:peptide/nickel transport system permease protein
LISLTSGLVLGLVGGYAGGWTERILMRLVDVLFSFTEIVIALACLAILGTGLTNAMIAVGIASIPFYARIAHSVVLVEKNKPYFECAIAAGAGHARLIGVHLLPNVMPTMVVVGTLGISTAVLAAAGLSFLGLGAQPPVPEWGFMLAASRDLISRAPWTMIFPGLAIALTVLGFNLLGDGIREVLDPRQKQR